MDDSFSFPTKSEATLDRILLSETLEVVGTPSREGSVDVVLGVNDGVSEAQDLEHTLSVIDSGGRENTVLFRYSAVAGEANAWHLRAVRSEGEILFAILRVDGEGRFASGEA